MTVLVNNRLVLIESQQFDIGDKAKEQKMTMIVVKGTDTISRRDATSFKDEYRSLAIVVGSRQEMRTAAQSLAVAAKHLYMQSSKMFGVSTDAILDFPTTHAIERANLLDFGSTIGDTMLGGKPATREAYRRKLFDMIAELDEMDDKEGGQ